jgi:hypothetical protein
MVSIFHALKASLERMDIPYRTGPFGSIIINDEYIWENYGIPMLSFSRFPYPEYHSSRDNMEIIRENSLKEAADALVGAIDQLESSPIFLKRFEGNICLSNPKYNFYVDYGQVALGDPVSDQRSRLRSLMDFVPSLDRAVTVKAIEYLEKWAGAGLIDLL